MINYDNTRGSVTVQTDPGPTQSRLTIRQAVETDTGNYTCSASNTKPASIFVFVTEGKYKQHVSKRTKRTSLINITWPRTSSRHSLNFLLRERIPLVMILGRAKLKNFCFNMDISWALDRLYTRIQTFSSLAILLRVEFFKRFLWIRLVTRCLILKLLELQRKI